MGNIAKIAALTALITLAFGITAIDVAMADSKEIVMEILIYNDGTTDLKTKYLPIYLGTVTATNDVILEHQGKPKEVFERDDDVMIIWTKNPCVWVKLNGVWKYICYR